jgi:serine/threonine protein kinase
LYHTADAAEDEVLDPSHLTFHKSLGVGGQAEVFLTTWRRLRGEEMIEELIAVKKMEAGRKSAMQEALMLKTDHPNIVRCLGATENASTFLIAMDYCAGGSLYNHIYNPRAKPLTWLQRIKILHDISEGMAYLHKKSPKIIHRDLKSPNVLLAEPVSDEDMEPQARITDFGVAVTAEAEALAKNYLTCVGTWRWTAPEVFRSSDYDEKVDIFSFAMLIYELITSRLPYSDKWPDSRTGISAQAILNITQGLRPILKKRQFKGCPSFLKDMMLKCWDHDPSARPSFAEIAAELKERLTLVKLEGNWHDKSELLAKDAGAVDASRYLSQTWDGNWVDWNWAAGDLEPLASQESDERELQTPPQTLPGLRSPSGLIPPAPPSTNPDRAPMPMTAPGGFQRFQPVHSPPTPPPSNNFFYDGTTVFIESDQPHEIGNSVLDYLTSQYNVCITKVTPNKCCFKADVFVDGVVACTMKVRIHSRQSETSQMHQYAVRCQRRSGCAFVFHNVFDSTQKFLAKQFVVVQNEPDVHESQADWFAPPMLGAERLMKVPEMPDVPDLLEDVEHSSQQKNIHKLDLYAVGTR